MSDSDRKVRVFISSTFKDMHAERDHMVTVVFPELRERCERLGLEFFDVDLRWGVPEKGADGETANSWEYCRQWIDRVEPFFVGMLGQRYGWIPPPEKLKDEADRARQSLDPRSITDMEVRYGLLDAKLKRHSFFYLRQAEVPATASDFVDPPPLLAKLDQLKTKIQGSGRPVRGYPCQWTGDAFTGMEAFGRMVLDDLWSGILRDPRFVSRAAWQQVLGADPDSDPRYSDESVPVPDEIAEKLIPLAKPPPKDPLDAEREQMAAFAASRLRWFQGRTKEIDDLTAFIRDPAADNVPRLAVIAAIPGQGKSALMAKLHSSLRVPTSAFVIFHFVGATEKSSSADHLVRRLVDELDSSGIAFPERPVPEGQTREEAKLDFNSLCQRLSERLGDYDGERRIVILLDALNQLDDGHDLGWLPHHLGSGVRIVVSCIDDTEPPGGHRTFDTVEPPEPEVTERFPPSSETATPSRKVLSALQARFPKPKFVPLGGLDAPDVRTIVEGYLLEYCKQLDTPYVDAICAMPQARNPLYLLVMLAELRTLGGNDMNQVVPELIANMAATHPDTVSLFKWLLQRMEAPEGFGPELVNAWCLYLALGRAGMASRELADLLARKFAPDGAATALRIERGLRRYLQRRGETLDVFHDQLRQAIFESYGSEESTRDAHRDIADYFRSLADPTRDKQWQGGQQRPFSEIAFHLIGSQRWDELCEYLTDFRCLDVRIRTGQVFEVVTDQRAVLAALPELAEEARRERERIANGALYGAAMIAYTRNCAAGKNPPLPPPPDTSGAGVSTVNSGEVFQRADRLRMIANFIIQKATLLAAFPKEFLPLVANAAEAGPLAEAAETADATVGPWLHRTSRPPSPPLRPQCLQTLQGHTGGVKSVCFTPDGRRAISAGGHDHTLRVWNLQNGQCLLTLRGRTGPVYSGSITSDGKWCLSANWDKTLRLWDIASARCLATLQGHSGRVNSVAISPDGSRAVSGSVDETLRVWDLFSGQCLTILQGHTSIVNSVALSPDLSLALSGSGDKTLRLWDLASGQCIQILQGHMSEINSVALSPDGSRALSGGSDRTLRFWDLASGQCVQILQGHMESVLSVALTPDGSLALSGSHDNTLRLWDLDSGQCIQTLQGHISEVNSVALTPDGSLALSGSADNTLRLWDLACGQNLLTLQSHIHLVKSVSLAPDGSRSVSASSDNTLRVWDLGCGVCLQTLHGHTKEVNSVSVTSDGQRAVSGSSDQTLRVWDLQTGACIHALQGHTKEVTIVSITPDGLRAVSASYDNTMRVWDLQSGKCLHSLQGHPFFVTSVSMTPAGRCAVSTGAWDQDLRVWDLQSGRCVFTLLGYNLDDILVEKESDGLAAFLSGYVYSVAVSPDGQLAVAGSGDCIVRVWNLQSGHCLMALDGHEGAVKSVSITPDGQHALTGSGDCTVRVWELKTGKCTYILRGHTGAVLTVRVAQGGRCAVSVGDDKTLRVWDLQSGQCLANYLTGTDVTSVAVHHLGDRIVCGTEDGQMHFLAMRNFPEFGL